METLDCKSLMIGDYVQTRVLRMNKIFEKESVMIPYKVVEVRKTPTLERVGDNDDDKYTIISRSDSIEPIPLTAKILEANGFILRTESPYRMVFELELSRENGGGCEYFSVEVNVKADYATIYYNHFDKIDRVEFAAKPLYVHQLQHVMRICGIKQTIELWN